MYCLCLVNNDMKEVWIQAVGINWDNENGYYSPDFQEWLTEYKTSKL